MFSKTHLRLPATQQDSVRLRNRLGAKSWEIEQANRDVAPTFVRIVHAETGARVPYVVARYDIADFFREVEFRDVLDGVTCMARALRLSHADAGPWIAFCQRAFDEEGIAYVVDDPGAAHYRVDVAFHETADSVVALLSLRHLRRPVLRSIVRSSN